MYKNTTLDNKYIKITTLDSNIRQQIYKNNKCIKITNV